MAFKEKSALLLVVFCCHYMVCSEPIFVHSNSTWNGAMQKCASKLNGTIPRSQSQHDFDLLLEKAKDQGLQSVWLGIKKQVYTKPYWLDNTPFGIYNSVIKDSRKQCGFLFLTSKTITLGVCHMRDNYGALCQKGLGCQNCAPEPCFEINQKCYFPRCGVRSWMEAYSSCLQRGMSLALLKTTNERDEVIQRLGSFSCNRFWLGLSTFTWIYVNQIKLEEEKEVRNVSFWLVGEPKGTEECVILDISHRRWRSADCSSYHAVMCEKTMPLTTPYIPDIEVTTSIAATSYQKHSDARLPLWLIIIIVVSVTLPSVAVAVAVAVICRLRRPRHNHEQTIPAEDQGHEEQPLLTTNNATINKLKSFYDVCLTQVTRNNFKKCQPKLQLHKLYVPMDIRKYTHGNTKTEPEKLESIENIFDGLDKERRPTRIVVDGEPGAGKTTFMKKLCHIWMNGEEPMKRYSLLVAIILRLVKPNSSLEDILKSQMGSDLEHGDIEVIDRMIENEPEKVCIILDGYDELICQRNEYIMRLITAEHSRKVTLLTTTRPHKLRELRSFNDYTVELHVNLKGFNKEHVKKYIQKYFDDASEDAKTMIFAMDKQDLWKLGRIPIRLEIMCYVWAIQKCLSKNMADLYEEFIKCLFERMEKGKEEAQNEKSPQTTKANSPKTDKSLFNRLLSVLGELANTYEKGHLKTVYSPADLEGKLSDLFDDAVTFGCITTYHPFRSLEDAPWCFTHLSLQEYLIAHDLAKCDDNKLNEFAEHVKTVSLMERHQLILNFLCKMEPNGANTVISIIAKEVNSNNDCRRLLVLMLDLLDHYDEYESSNLPLPKVLTVKESLGENIQVKLRNLFSSDYTHRNMKTIRVYNLDLMPEVVEKKDKDSIAIESPDYVSECYMFVKQNQKDKAITLLKSMSQLTCLHLKFDQNCKKPEIKDVLQCVSMLRLPTLIVQGKHIIGGPCWELQKMITLKKLKIIDDGDITEDNVQDLACIMDELNTDKLFIGCSTFNSSFMTLSNKALLYFKIRKCDLKSLSDYTKGYEEKHINMLDLSQSEKSKNQSTLGALYGKYLADILVSLPKLKILKLRNTGLDSNSMDGLLKKISIKPVEFHLEELDLLANSIQNGGATLGKILSHFPKLNTLLISLSLENMIAMAEELQDTRKPPISRLMIAGSDLTGKSDLTPLWKKLEQLEELYFLKNDMGKENEMQNVFPSVPNFSFPKLRVLYSDILKPLVAAVSNMPALEELHIATYQKTDVEALEELHIATCQETDVEDVIRLITNFPKSIKYLNLSNNKIAGLTQLLRVKDKLDNLAKLQIGFDQDDEEDIGLIRQDLASTLEVYHDSMETQLEILRCSADSTPTEMDLEPLKDVKEL